MLDVIQLVGCVAGNKLPFAGCAFIIGVVRQLKVGLSVLLGQPHHDLVFTVGEAVGAVRILLDRPDDGLIVGDDLVVGRSDGLRDQIPVVVGLVLDGLTVARVVDNDLVAVLHGSGQDIGVAAGDIGRSAAGDVDTAAAVDGAVVHAQIAQDAVGGSDLMLAADNGEGRDVVGQDHVVFHDVVQDVDGALEHGEAVAQVTEGVVVAGQVVVGLQIQSLVLAGLLVVDLDVLHAVVAGGTAGPNALAVLLDGACDVGVDIIGDTGNLEEAAALSAAHVTGAPFQSVQELLAGDGLQAGHVAEGVDILAGLVGDVAGDSLVTDAAAVHDGYVDIQAHVVKQVVQSIGSKVAGVGLLLADQTLAVSVVVVELEGGMANDLAQHIVNGVDPAVLDAGNSGVGAVEAGDQLGLDAVVGDGHLADGVEVGAGLGQDDGVAGLVLDGLHCHGAVRVAVDEGVQSGGVGDDILGGPGLGGGVVAQVAKSDDVVGLFSLGSVDGSLHGVVQIRTGHAAGDAVDVVAGLILEVSRSGLGEGFGGGDADDGDLLAANLENLVGVKDIAALHTVGLMVEVAGDIGEVGLLGDLQSALHAVVKLVVAQSGQVIVRGAHELDDGLALIHGAVSGTLDMVAGIDQEDAVGDLRGLGLQIGNVVIGQAAVDVGVNVVGVVDHDLALVRQLVAADGADAVNILMAESGNGFRLGLAALGAGIEHFALILAGGLGNDFAFIPLVLGAGEHDLLGNGDDLGQLGTGGMALGIQRQLAVIQGAADDALGNGPVKGCLSIGRDLLGIGEILQIILVDFQLAVEAPDHGDQLLTGHKAVRIEMGSVNAVDDFILLSPDDSVLIPVILQINELGGVDGRDHRVSQAVQDHGSHGAGTGAVGVKENRCYAVHELRVMVVGVGDVGRKPIVLLDILERLDIACCRKDGGKNADNHSDHKQERHDFLECVFHCLSSLNFQIYGL